MTGKKRPGGFTPPVNRREEGSRLALANSRELFDAACVLGERKMYGPASALLVLSLEEAVKSVAYRWTSLVSGLTKALRPLLQSHAPRHQFARIGTQAFAFGSRWMSLNAEIKAQYPDYAGDAAHPARQRAVASFGAQIQGLITAQPHESIVVDILDWLGEADTRKMRGLYVDYRLAGWVTPQLVTFEEFQRSKAVVQRLLDEAISYDYWYSEMTPEDRETLASDMRALRREFEGRVRDRKAAK